jgi:hypothetical protein
MHITGWHPEMQLLGDLVRHGGSGESNRSAPVSIHRIWEKDTLLASYGNILGLNGNLARHEGKQYK